MPIADMLAYSPPLPLIINYKGTDITAGDKEAMILVLGQQDCVQHIQFYLPVLKLQKLITAIDGAYPILKYLILWDPHEDKSMVLILPRMLQTPYLCHLVVNCSIQIPIWSLLLGTSVGLVTLYLWLHYQSTYMHLTVLHQWLLLMPQLEILGIFFLFAVSNCNVERQLMHIPIITYITLSNLCTFCLKAVSAYSKAIFSWSTAPHLKEFQINYPKQLTFSVL